MMIAKYDAKDMHFCRSGSTDMNNISTEPASESSVDESVSQQASSESAETDVKDSAVPPSEEPKKIEIPMPSGPKTRQAFQSLMQQN